MQNVRCVRRSGTKYWLNVSLQTEPVLPWYWAWHRKHAPQIRVWMGGWFSSEVERENPLSWGSKSFAELEECGWALRDSRGLDRCGERGWNSRLGKNWNYVPTELLPCIQHGPSHFLCPTLSSPVAWEGFTQGWAKNHSWLGVGSSGSPPTYLLAQWDQTWIEKTPWEPTRHLLRWIIMKTLFNTLIYWKRTQCSYPTTCKNQIICSQDRRPIFPQIDIFISLKKALVNGDCNFRPWL